MKIDVRFRSLQSSEFLRDHAVRRVLAHLSRFGTEISGVVVRIADVNGPKGGLDKQCQVLVRGPRFGSTTLEELSSDAYAAVDLAVERLSRAVGRQLERARSLRRRPTLRAAR